MHKQQRAEIKALIVAQIASLSKKVPTMDDAPGARLRLERLGTALRRVEADNFGDCFKCEKPIEASRLRAHPETILCGDCLESWEEQS